MKKLLLSFFLLITYAAAFAQAPAITYNGPQQYVQGATITDLVPNNTGGAVPAATFAKVATLAGTPGSIGMVNGTGAAARFKGPAGAATDSKGNVFIADKGNNKIRMVTPAGVVTTFASVNKPEGIAIDANDNLFVTDFDQNKIYKILPNGTVSDYAGTGEYGLVNGPAVDAKFAAPQGIAVDKAGNVYVADLGNNRIRKIDITGNVSTFAGNGGAGLVDGPAAAASFRSPYGVAVNAGGDVFVTDQNNRAIRKISGGVVSTLAGGTAGSADGVGSAASFNTLFGITIDKGGNLFVADAGNNTIRYITPAGEVVTIAGMTGEYGTDNGTGLATTFFYPEGIANDGNGNLYVVDFGTSVVRKIGVTGYSINPALPAGLNFDATTGRISGTPTDPSPATDYTIGAYNLSGSSRTTLNITVREISKVATLSNLVTNRGSLYPAFAPELTRYVLNVSNGIGNIRITPTKTDPLSNITINGTPIASGSTSGTLPLNTGNNTFVVAVTAESGDVTQYNLSVYRAKAAVALPNITYPAPAYTFTVNTPITTIAPKNTGGSVPANAYGDVTTIKTGLTSPTGVTYDSQGNVYVAERDANRITKISPGGASSVWFGPPDLLAPSGLGTDQQGNIYIAEAGNNRIDIVSPDGKLTVVAGTSTDPGSADGLAATEAQFNFPTDVSSNANGDLYVADLRNNKIRKIGLDGKVTTLAPATPFNEPVGLASDPAGNVYVGDSKNNIIRKISSSGTSTVFAGSGAEGHANGTGTAATFVAPMGVANDDLGNLYVADAGNAKIRKITTSGVVSVLAGNGTFAFNDGLGSQANFSYPVDVAADKDGHLYVADYSNNAIRKIELTGYFITPALPAGLVFDAKTGQISGTPTTISAPRNYAITAYNLGGNNTTRVTISVDPPANIATLSNLATSAGTLDPVFDAATLSYSATVASGTSSVTIKPTATDAAATIKVNGEVVASAATSSAITLSPGPNPIPVVVTSSDGTVTNTYTVTITRQAPPASNDATLAGLSISSGTLTPVFNTAQPTYDVSVGNSVSSITITPTGSEAHAVIKVGGNVVASGTSSTAIPLITGTNVVSILVTAQDGSTKTYTVTVTRAQSSNADLASLTLSAGTLAPVFDANTTTYAATVANNVSSLTITPTSADATATIKVNGTTVGSGSASAPIALAVNGNPISVLVTAQDGSTKTYNITVTRAQSSNADLAALTLSAGTLAPVFDANTTTYTATVANNVSSITLTPTAADATATIKVNGTTVTSGSASAAIALAVNDNVVSVVVTAQDGSTKTYNITVTRAQSSNADLASLTLSAGTLAPVFDASKQTYTANVANNISSLTITPTSADATAMIKVNGTTVASGSASAPIALAVNDNVVSVLVTAQDGSTKTYNITVTRARSSIADLASLTLSAGTLAPVFNSNQPTYAANVANNVSSLTITPTSADATATIKVNGTTVGSGSASAPIALVVNDNPINVLVTAQDGSTKTYTITVARAKSSIADLASLTLSAGTLAPAFNSNQPTYAANVANNVSSLTITPTSADATATIKVNGTTVSSGSASAPIALAVNNNVVSVLVTAQDGSTKTYNITVTRARSSNADLASLTLSAGTLAPVFNSTQPTYAATVANNVSSLTITPTSADATASIKVNGTTVTSGSASAPIALAVNDNVISVLVTAQDGSTKPYTVTVTRAKSSDANLSGLTISAGKLDPAFSPTRETYQVNVGNSTTSVTLTPSAQSAAVIRVNGKVVPNGSASPAITLDPDINTIAVSVTSEDGTATKNYTVTVIRELPSNADLKDLAVSSGTLDPKFNTAQLSYNVAVSNDVKTVTITPAADDASAVIRVNGQVVASGAPSLPIALQVLDNPIDVIVTAGNGATKTYTVTFNRAKSSNADLVNLVPTEGKLTPDFLPRGTTYHINLANDVQQISFTPTVSDPTARVLVHDIAVASGTTSPAIALHTGDNNIDIVVTAEDQSTKVYTVIVNRALSANANLVKLETSTGTYSPAFDRLTTTYTMSVDNDTKAISVTPFTEEPNATVKVNGISVTSGEASGQIALKVPDNTVNIQVNAEDGTTVKVYTLKIKRAASSNANLASLKISTGTLDPVFDPATTSYVVKVANAVKEITFSPTLADLTAAVKVKGVGLASGATSPVMNLKVRDNVINIEVTAEDGTVKTYVVNVIRAPSSNANLANLTVNSGSFSPGFGKNIISYTMLVKNNVLTMVVTPTLEDNTATITVDGVAVTNGSASQPVALKIPNTFINTVVTAEDGVTKKTYTIIVNRALSSDNDLSSLTISAGQLTPNFQSGINDYAVEVNNNVLSVTLKPVVADAAASVKVNGVAVASGTNSQPQPLQVNDNKINVVVTAQNGETNTYVVKVKRAPSANADLAALTSSKGTLSPVFASDKTDYIVKVSSAVSELTFTPTVSDNTATVKVNGSAVASGSASKGIPLTFGPNNRVTVEVTAQNGTTIKKYIVDVTRELSPNADLAGITLNNGTLKPDFDPNTPEYHVDVTNDVEGISITPQTSDAYATVTVDGTPVASGQQSDLVPLIAGQPKTITIVVKAQNGDVKTYNIIAKRELSANADLSALGISSGTLDPAFSQDRLTYNVEVPFDVTAIDITPTPADRNATLQVNGQPLNIGDAQHIALVPGPNPAIVIKVTAQNGVNKEYKVNITRRRSPNAYLRALSASTGLLDPAFVRTTTDYNIAVPNAVAGITLTPTADDADALIQVDGKDVTSGTASGNIALTPGIGKPVQVIVTAADGSSKTYTVKITRALSDNNLLTNLALSFGTLDPAFVSGTVTYNSRVPNAVNKIKVMPTAADHDAVITIKNVRVASGTASDFIELQENQNTINVIVKAPNGDERTYTINIIREVLPPSNNATLASLTPSVGILSPEFRPDGMTYNILVKDDVTRINLTPVSSEAHAKITVSGVPVQSGQTSGDFILADGPNKIFVVVTAQDGVTRKNYEVTVTKTGLAAALPNMFTPNGDGHNDTWKLPNIELYPQCTVKVFDRGGHLVYSSIGYSIPWDGTYNGKLLPPDVYYYIIDLKQGQGIRSGTVNIIR